MESLRIMVQIDSNLFVAMAKNPAVLLKVQVMVTGKMLYNH